MRLIKKKYVILIFALAMLFIEYKSLERMLSKGLFRVVYVANVLDSTSSRFAIGYRDIQEETLKKIIEREGFVCRSLRLNLSREGQEIIHEIEMYCDSDQLSSGVKVNKAVDLMRKPIEENNVIGRVDVKLVDVRLTKNESGRQAYLLILSLLFSFLVFLALPFSSYIQKGRE
jgi:hypothetical protein